MSYRCVMEAFIGKAAITIGTVIEHVGHDSKLGDPCMTSSIDEVHYAMRPDVFREHFEEVEPCES